nr:Uma2 family endonuclease [Pseudanabaena sp. UWO311]
MADNTKQFELIVEIKKGLDLLFINNPQVFVAGDLFWYPVEGQSKIVTAPDVMVAMGRPKGDRGSYKQWEEDNIAPQVVFEILSPSNNRAEMSKKLLFFERYGVEEYYLYDPEENVLEVWQRTFDGLSLMDFSDSWTSPRLGIRLDIASGRLQLYNADGTKFYSYIEVNLMLEQERQRADQEHQRADQECQRADQINQQLAEMQEILKQYRDRFGELPE